MKIPQGKTAVMLKADAVDRELKMNDTSYIDGYVSGPHSSPYAIFIRDSDGLIDMVSISNLQAIHGEKSASKKSKEDWDIDGFNFFWENYPKPNTGKATALSAWNKLKPDFYLRNNMLNHYSIAYKNTEEQFMPNASTYLNKAKWTDAVIKVAPKFLKVPNYDDKLWPFANQHGLKQPGQMSYFDYRNALRKEVAQKQLMEA